MYHDPVLLNQCIDGLSINPNGVYVDATMGGGGHSRAIFDKLENGKLIAFDQDADSLQNAINDERFIMVNQNFKYLKNFLKFHGFEKVDGILADLGVSSHQFDEAERGFSTRFNANLDMRMDRKQAMDAATIINTYDQDELIRVFKDYGEIKSSYKLALTICEKRELSPIKTTAQLNEIIADIFPKTRINKFQAMVFQALRIEVNDELSALKSFLKQTPEVLNPGGRLVIMSYHSLEDRLVKNFIRSGNFQGKVEKDFYGHPLVDFKTFSSKPIVPDEDEIERNNRARSAKLRIAERK
ncbi:MAG: 16S rRNA (cytosine(1402)-N(4))-methyltransferase [Marinilabiliales bacterium]|nr:MAG: 16S rRNA (cytosine(1402)-N(4))-methyltransferase [Marinilabiliales bacterium]